jgi:hypothetical protein
MAFALASSKPNECPTPMILLDLVDPMLPARSIWISSCAIATSSGACTAGLGLGGRTDQFQDGRMRK